MSSKADGRPSFQFYPDDWLAESSLRLCNLSARGLWIELLCHMWRAPERGVICVANHSRGKQSLEQTVSRLVGRPIAEVKQALTQLKDYGVCSTRDNDTIYSRRMVDEERLRRSKVIAGRKGGLSRGQAQREAERGSSSSTAVSTPSVKRKEESSPTSPKTETPPRPAFFAVCADKVDDVRLIQEQYQNRFGPITDFPGWDKFIHEFDTDTILDALRRCPKRKSSFAYLSGICLNLSEEAHQRGREPPLKQEEETFGPDPLIDKAAERVAELGKRAAQRQEPKDDLPPV